MQCPNCHAEILNESANFCIECGYSLQGVKGKVKGYSKRISSFIKRSSDEIVEGAKDLRTTINEKVGEYRKKASIQLDAYINSIENQKQVTFKGYVLSNPQKNKMLNRLKLLQSRIKVEDFANTNEYQEWIDHLDSRLENSRCIICFQEWTNKDEIVVCNGCYHGGHKDHFISWVNTTHKCPLCRKDLTPADLVNVLN